MVYSNESTGEGIVQEARYFVGANSTSYPINDLTRNVNRWFDKAVALIFKSNGRWQWDDANQTTYPQATTDLASGQQDYTLDVSHLKITRVEVKDEQGELIESLLLKIGQASDENADDLKRLSGVGSALEKKLNQLGVYKYQQISKMSDKEFNILDRLIDAFPKSKSKFWSGEANILNKI